MRRIATTFIIALSILAATIVLMGSVAMAASKRDADTKQHKVVAEEQATKKAVSIIQKYSRPSYLLKKEMEYSQWTKKGYKSVKFKKNKKYKYLKNIAKKTTKKCKTDREKIKAIAEVVSARIYYDYAHYEGKTKMTPLNPYAVWKKRKTVCQGYSNLSDCMLRSIGIPATIITGDNHAYNAAYMKDEKKWIFFDSTWNSGNRRLSNGEWINGPEVENYFDLTPETMARIGYHQIYEIDGIVKGNTVYRVVTNGFKRQRSKAKKNYVNVSGWEAVPVGQVKKKKYLKIASSAAGLKVKRIQEFSFFNVSRLRKIYLPSSIKKVERHAFYVDWKGRQIRTIVITKASKKKLNFRNGWGNRKVVVKRR